MAEAPLHAAVYVTSSDERQTVEKLLRRDDRVAYDGVLEGWLDPDAVRQLAERGIVVDPIEGDAPEPALALPHLERQGHVDADDPRLSGFHSEEPRVLEPEPDAAPEVAFYHVRLEGPITEEQRTAFVDAGVDLAAFEPPDSYRTRLTREQYALVRAAPGVRAVERYRVEETLTPGLVEELEDRPGERRTFDLVLHRIADADALSEELAGLDGVNVLDASYLFIRFEAPLDRELVATVARLPGVRRLGLYEPPSLMCSHARPLVGVEGLPWTGKDEVVAVFDSGIDSSHQDFAGQILSVDSVQGASKDDTIGHGTHVAGIIAGTGAASAGENKGVAPGAKLAVIGFVGDDMVPLIPPNWADLLKRALASGAKVINLSVGTNFRGQYDFGSLALDEFVWANPEVLVVIAAGNSGVAPEGWVGFHTVGSPASSKNALTVGASDTDRPEIELTWGSYNQERFPSPPCANERMSGDPDCPAALSSRGPTDSEAVKPDVLAPGTYILAPRASSTRIPFLEAPGNGASNDAYGYLGGTSMAAPVVAGCAAVVREYLREERDLANPSAALLKAILIASARRMKPRDLPAELREEIGYPDFDQGFGRIDLTNVLPHPQAPATRRLEYDDVRQDGPKALASRGQVLAQQTYTFTVADVPAGPLRAVLAWTDWPSDGVQNNLQLKVTPPGGAPIYGNPEHRLARRKADELLEAYLPKSAERPPALDKRNNVEQVVIDRPAAGDYTINVIAENTPKPPQGYALAVVGGLTGALSS
ncbi:MAG: serine protease AprX [Thermoleophilaceae bacterium]|nr:serine protease AprX [Thermoleophilaceae bacterium]